MKNGTSWLSYVSHDSGVELGRIDGENVTVRVPNTERSKTTGIRPRTTVVFVHEYGEGIVEFTT